jgi:hypothetical protein
MKRRVTIEISECWTCPWNVNSNLYASEGFRYCSHPQNGTIEKQGFHGNRPIKGADFPPKFPSWCPLEKY